MKVYTRTGDSGQTSLYDGHRVDKDDIRIESYGVLDELNSQIGLCLHYVEVEDKKVLQEIQRKLFDICGELATRELNKFKVITNDNEVKYLEDLIDSYREKTDNVNAFIIPGTSIASANLHIARAICRRGERRIISLNKVEKVNPSLIKYINRLSDFLYAIARYYEKELILIEF